MLKFEEDFACNAKLIEAPRLLYNFEIVVANKLYSITVKFKYSSLLKNIEVF